MQKINQSTLRSLAYSLEGSLHWDENHLAIYSTDASVYRKQPLAVAFPKNKEDVQKLIFFAQKHKSSLIPRTAGTSLAGQCVGEGIVVDVSRYLNKVLEINKDSKWVRLQPGVVRDKLNQLLAPDGLFFPPETATANRAMIGGMIGNNSCGANSIVYGTTRDFVISLKGFLSDGSEAEFSLKNLPFSLEHQTLESKIYKHLIEELTDAESVKEIDNEFPKKSIHRRNTGYAVDLVADDLAHNKIDLCRLICGSEGTLLFVTEIKLKLVELPPSETIMICPHFDSIDECMKAVIQIMKHKPFTCEMMDKVIIDCTERHPVFRDYKFFVEGDPAALLMIEFRSEDKLQLEEKANFLIQELKSAGLGYAYPLVLPPFTKKVWELRKAGLGLLANMPGEKKAIECIEDMAVALEDLPDFIHDFTMMMDGYNQHPLYYAHAGAGELHLRPVLNMHDPEDRKQFRSICEDSARLVKKYKGSLSGEHGDGRLRGELIPFVLGQKNYELLVRLKQTWDPSNIFNPGKIVNTPKLDEDLRYDHNISNNEIETLFDFSDLGGYYEAAARCTGSADCRKPASLGGTMCPSFMATVHEKDSTRARANALREFYSKPSSTTIHKMESIKEILDLCLSCKGCHNECPSQVDMTALKAEFSHQYRLKNGLELRSRLFGEIDTVNRLGGLMPGFTNFIQEQNIFKKILGIHSKRKLPSLHKFSLRHWVKKFKLNPENKKQKLVFFIDEFTNRYDVEIGIKAICLLDKLGYQILFTDHESSGRAQFSKGMLPEAKSLAQKNIEKLIPFVSEALIIGLEPSAILSFRDEYPRLFRLKAKTQAEQISKICFTIEEFLYQEIQKGNINANMFDKTIRHISVHGHCHQKALSKMDYTGFVLGLPVGHHVSIIASGCCGMAGSFGYEKEHYDLSMNIGNLVLFPAIRNFSESEIIAASGTSCRHQILDGTARHAVHPVEILWQALKNTESN